MDPSNKNEKNFYLWENEKKVDRLEDKGEDHIGGTAWGTRQGSLVSFRGGVVDHHRDLRRTGTRNGLRGRGGK